MRIPSLNTRHLTKATLLALACIMLLTQSIASAAGAARDYRNLGMIPGSVAQSFSFAVATDSHVGYGPATRNTAAALADMAARYSDLSFMIHMGDLTETGSDAEYREIESLLAPLGLPVFATLGNHESRWQDPQGSLFRSRLGSPNTSFNWGAWHFVILDTTYPGETLGTLDPATVSWLQEDLEKNPGRPVAVFSHHPLLYLESKFQDSDAAFARIMDEFPVRVVFSGHGHSFIKWRAQGQRFQMVGALMDGAYAIVSVEGLGLTVKSATPGPDGAYVDQVLWKAAVDPATSLAPGNPVAALSAEAMDGTLSACIDLSRPAEAYFQIDNGSFVPLGRLPMGTNPFTFDVSRHAKGNHTLTVKAVTAEGPFFSTTGFGKDPADIEVWRRDLGSSIVGGFAETKPGEVAVGTRDGMVRGLRLKDGEELWSLNAGSQWGGGAVDKDKLYFGTAEGVFFCVDASTGSLRWKTSLDPAGFAAAPTFVSTPAGRKVVVASVSGKVYGLNAFSGAKEWLFEAQGAVVSPPVSRDGAVYFGSWDTHLYALDASSGALLWSVQLGRQVYYSPYLTAAVFGDTVYATTVYDTTAGGSFLYAIDASTGEVKWRITGKSSFMSPWVSAGYPVTVMDASGAVSAFSQTDGGSLWSIPGSSTLFGDAQGSGPRFVTGGYRGVLGLLIPSGRADFVLGDGHLFVSPLITSAAGLDGRVAALVADTRGNLHLLAFPE